MHSFNIGVYDNDKELFNYLDRKNNGYNVNNVEYSNFTSIICGSKRYMTKNDLYAFINNISDDLADYVMEKYESKFVRKIVETDYCYFNRTEKENIFFNIIKVLSEDQREIRKSIISKSFSEYFKENTTLNLKGFLNFRLKGYQNELEYISELVVEKILTEKEYLEFIKLLQYFVSLQSSKYNLVHIIPQEKGGYIFLDENREDISIECSKEFLQELYSNKMNYDDLLVSALITIAPEKIVIHKKEKIRNKEIINTIISVFETKVEFCRGCAICVEADSKTRV